MQLIWYVQKWMLVVFAVLWIVTLIPVSLATLMSASDDPNINPLVSNILNLFLYAWAFGIPVLVIYSFKRGNALYKQNLLKEANKTIAIAFFIILSVIALFFSILNFA